MKQCLWIGVGNRSVHCIQESVKDLFFSTLSKKIDRGERSHKTAPACVSKQFRLLVDCQCHLAESIWKSFLGSELNWEGTIIVHCVQTCQRICWCNKYRTGIYTAAPSPELCCTLYVVLKVIIFLFLYREINIPGKLLVYAHLEWRRQDKYIPGNLKMIFEFLENGGTFSNSIFFCSAIEICSVRQLLLHFD